MEKYKGSLGSGAPPSREGIGVMSPPPQVTKSGIAMLDDQVRELKAARNRLQQAVDDAKSNRKRVPKGVQRWLKSAEKVIEEAEKLNHCSKISPDKRWFSSVLAYLRTKRIRKKVAKKLKKLPSYTVS